MAFSASLPASLLALVLVSVSGSALSLTSVDRPLLNGSGTVGTIAVAPDGTVYFGGSFLPDGTTQRSVVKVRPGGSVDSSFAPELVDFAQLVRVQSDGKVLIAESSSDALGFGFLRRYHPDGTEDPDFTPALVNDSLIEILFEDDGSLLLAGRFTQVGGVQRRGLARLHPNGELDESFDVNLSSSFQTEVNAMVRLPDGRLMIGGFFNQVDGTSRRSLARLYPDGSLDTSFSVSLPSGTNIFIRDLAARADGGVVVTGNFTSIGGQSRQGLALLRADGTVSDFDPAPNGNQWSGLVMQPDGRILVAGNFTEIGGQAVARLARLMPDGSVDPSFDIEVVGQPNLIVPDVGDQSFLLGGIQIQSVNGESRPGFYRIANSGVLQQSLAINVAGGGVQALAIQADDQLLIGGEFQQLGGLTRTGLARLRIDGELDSSYDPAPDGPVRVVAALANGDSLVAGDFTSIDQQPALRLARLTADGDLDPAFAASVDGPVHAMAIQGDGRIVIGGSFATVNEQPRGRLARLNPDGSLDVEFSPDSNDDVHSLAIDSQGRILVGGGFSQINGLPRQGLARLSTSGQLDGGFSPSVNGAVRVIRAAADGSVVLGGDFSAVAGTARNHLARLSAGGTLDPDFNPAANGPVLSLVMQADGKLLIAGQFSEIAGLAIDCCVARLNPDGTLDGALQDGVNTGARVNALAMQADGQVVIAGDFFEIGGQLRPRLARLQPLGPRPNQALRVAPEPNRVEWSRPGFAAELDRVHFDFSTDGSSWIALGAASRSGQGWQLEAPGLPENELFYLRASGQKPAGQGNGSTVIHEQVLQGWIRASLLADRFEQSQ